MKKVVWTRKAQRDFNETYNFWIDLNKSDRYSEKLLDETLRMIRIISKNPEVGPETKKKKLRRVIIDRTFSMTYRVENDSITIISFFDGRRKPE